MKFLSAFGSKSTFRDGRAVVIDQGMMSLGTFIVGILVARSVSQEDYGVYVLGWSLIAIIHGIQRALVVLPFTVYCPKLSNSERGRHIGSGLIHSLAVGLLSILSFILISASDTTNPGGDAAGLIATLPLVAALVIPLMLREQMRSSALAQLDFTGSARINTVASMLMIAAAAGLYVTGSLSLGTAYVTMSITALLSGLLLLSRQWNIITFSRPDLFSDLLDNTRIGKWILVNVITFTLSAQIYPWLILWHQDATMVAAYGACLALAGAMNPLMRGITTYALPRMAHGFSQKNTATLMRMLKKTIALISIPFALWTLACAIFAEPLMTLIYDDKYPGLGLLLFILLIKTMVESMSAPITSALQAIERPDITTISLAVGAMTSVTLGITLTAKYGATGAAIAAVCATVATFAWKYFHLMRACERMNSNEPGQ